MHFQSQLLLACTFAFLYAVAHARPECSDQACCSQFNSGCKSCLGNDQCGWCSHDPATGKGGCLYYSSTIPNPAKNPPGGCSVDDWHIYLGNLSASCSITERTALIVGLSVAGALLLGIGLGIYCCCKKRTKKRRQRLLDEYNRMDDYPVAANPNSDQADRRTAYREKYSDLYSKYGVNKK